MKTFEAHPIGLMPEWRHIELRIQAIDEAIARYEKARNDIPFQWVCEKNRLTDRLSKLREV